MGGCIALRPEVTDCDTCGDDGVAESSVGDVVNMVTRLPSESNCDVRDSELGMNTCPGMSGECDD